MIQEIYCSTWSQFREYIFRDLFGNSPIRDRFIFRGQGNAEWTLSSTFDRSFPDYKHKEREDLAKRLIENFKDECRAEHKYKALIENDNNNEIMALAQHFGLPTRLLDWSSSPYVSAFFAFQSHFFAMINGRSSSCNVAIWILDTNNYIWSETNGVQVLQLKTWDNERLRNQQGWFTLSRTPFPSLEEYVKNFDGAEDALKKLTLPSSLAAEAISDLDLMGINSGSLFPDLEGRARAAITKALLLR
jgi:hypothetical protein